MVYKKFGNTTAKVSALGFGAMRLPMTDKKTVDYERSAEAIIRAYKLGVNYFDTAPYYCESGSEAVLGRVLKPFRDKVYISTKSPVKNASGDDWRRELERSLRKLDTEYIDFYHMWGISLDTFKNKIDVPNGPMPAAIKAREEGLIRHISFSYHDAAENMSEIIDSGYFESVLMQYNLLDRSNEGNLRYAKEKGLGTVVMGPVGGGRLGAPSKVIRQLITREVASTAEMALRFVFANPDADIVLSGMENVPMVEENVRVAVTEGALTSEEMGVVKRIMEENKKLSKLYCTGCGYCMPCPQGINIPHVFSLMNYHRVYELTDYSKTEYAKLKIDMDKRGALEKPKGWDVSVCAECGECEDKCPQKLNIIRQLKETQKALETWPV